MRGWTWSSNAFSKGLNELTTCKLRGGKLGLSDLTERDAVEQAMAEYDELGRDAFLSRYGYGPARSYFVVHDGKRYDSKALAGAAVGKQFPASGPLAASEFSGGE